jgi:replicative DNA helicase
MAIKAGAMLALDDVRADTTTFVQWPWPSLHKLTGYLRPKRVHYVAAFPGNGKTSILSACLRHWVQTQQKRVCYLPLEASREEAVARLAADMQGLSIDEIQQGFLQERAEQGDALANDQLDRYERQLEELALDDSTLGQCLWIHSMESLTQAGVEQLRRQLEARHVEILLVDHVDHSDASGANGYALSEFIQRAMLQIAKQLNIVVILATQLNSKATGGNRIAKTQMAQMEWLWMKGVKEQVAALVVCLYRPHRPGIDQKEVDAAKRGDAEWWTITEPRRIAVGLMKVRYGGANTGKSAILAYEGTEIRELSLTERFERGQAENGIRTNWES